MDTAFQSLQAACDAAGKTKDLLISGKWTSLSTQKLACNIYAANGGMMQPAAGATVTVAGTFNGDLTLHLDESLGGTFNLSEAKIPILYPQWFGALCGGVDDTIAWQNTLSHAAFRTVLSPCQSTVTHVWVPAESRGVILQGTSYSVPLNNASSMGDTLIARAGSSEPVLTIYAASVHLKDFGVGCNNSASIGIVFSGAIQSIADSFQADRCIVDDIVETDVVGTFTHSGTGAIVTPAPGTSTKMTSELLAASGTSFTVADPVFEGQTLGGMNCGGVMLSYGTPIQEYLSVTVAGKTASVSKPVYTHPIGSTAQCSVNNDSMVFINRRSFFGRGWGFDILAGTDDNGTVDHEPTDFANALGGVLVSGSGYQMFGGHSEGNGGPAVQLGDTLGFAGNGKNGRTAISTLIYPFTDLENTAPSYNAVVSVCGQVDTAFYSFQAYFMPAARSNSCSAGEFDLGFGQSVNPDTSAAQFSVKNAHGLITLEPFNGEAPSGPSGLGFDSLTSVTGCSVAAEGSGYLSGEIVTVNQSGAFNAQVTVTVVDGKVTACTPIRGAQGIGYSVANKLSTTGGSGSGLSVNVTSIGQSHLSPILSWYERYTKSLAAFSRGSVSDYTTCQLSVANIAAYELCLGIRSDTNRVFIQSLASGTAGQTLEINPHGGNVILGSASATETINGQPIAPNVPVGTGKRGLYLCVDSDGRIYKNSSCP